MMAWFRLRCFRFIHHLYLAVCFISRRSSQTHVKHGQKACCKLVELYQVWPNYRSWTDLHAQRVCALAKGVIAIEFEESGGCVCYGDSLIRDFESTYEAMEFQKAGPYISNTRKTIKKLRQRKLKKEIVIVGRNKWCCNEETCSQDCKWVLVTCSGSSAMSRKGHLVQYYTKGGWLCKYGKVWWNQWTLF